MLKKIGMVARKEIEEILDKRVYLNCFVKIQKGWRDNAMVLRELGYEHQ